MQATVNFACYNGAVAINFDLGRKSRLRPTQQGGQHLACCVHVIVNRLLAAQHQAGLLFVNDCLEDLCDGQWLDIVVHVIGCNNQNRAVSTHGQSGTQGFLRLLHANRNNDDFVNLTSLFEANCLFDGNFVERVHRHFYVGKINTRSVRFDTYFYVVVDHALNRYQYLHGRFLLGLRFGAGRPGHVNSVWV